MPRPTGRGELIAGAVLVGWSAAAAIVIALRPGPNTLDRWGFDWLAKSPDSALYLHTTDLGAAAVLAAGSVLAALVVVRRDRWRALACVAGPLGAALLVEYVIKPTVGRRYLGVLSFPSGNVTDVASLSTAWAVAVPARIRPFVVAVGVVVTAMMAIAVTGLRWHYPSDALAGAVLGAGTVLLVDGLLHLPAVTRQFRR